VQQYKRLSIQVHESPLTINGLILSHEPMDSIPSGKYNLAGHIHPGIHLRGKARQTLTLPCFYFGANHGLLPAFGSFTGLACVKPKKNDRVYVVVGETVKRVH
jgi:uncharacterized protein